MRAAFHCVIGRVRNFIYSVNSTLFSGVQRLSLEPAWMVEKRLFFLIKICHLSNEYYVVQFLKSLVREVNLENKEFHYVYLNYFYQDHSQNLSGTMVQNAANTTPPHCKQNIQEF